MSQKWNYNIWLDDDCVATSGDEDFNSWEEAHDDATKYIKNNLLNDLLIDEEDYIIECYEVKE